MSSLRICPPDVYFDNKGVCTLKQVVVQLTAATNNQTVIAAVTGKLLRIFRVVLHPIGNAAERVVFKSGSGGTNLASYWLITPTGATANVNVIDHAPIEGLFDTASGVGLFADNSVGQAVNCTVRYAEFSTS